MPTLGSFILGTDELGSYRASLQFPLACFVGLAVGGVEVVVGGLEGTLEGAPAGYVRQPVVLEYCVDGATIANLASLQWQHALHSWGTIDGVQLWSGLVGGTLLGLVPPIAPVAIRQYDIARIPASGLAVIYANVLRSYGGDLYGTHPYGANQQFQAWRVLLERDFDLQDACTPGNWAPGPFSLAA